jgi:asparagine synthase (glutamine-hydrolysing)
MCGIFGKIGYSALGPEIGNAIRHRGPDDSGLFVSRISETPYRVTLGHRRLSIIDLSPAGHQPMCNEDETIWIVFNGEIYNFQDLRRDLVNAGHCFRSLTDTETIIHGYEQWGDKITEHLRGMFAFAIWDSRHQRLLLARDAVGKKPLFYYFDSHKLIFGSEIKAILATGEVPVELDPVALHDYLTYLYFPAPSTAYKNICKLAPGTCMSFHLTGDSLEKREWSYWDAVQASAQLMPTSSQAIIEQTRALIDEAVRLRLVSDVPLGVFLSGGLDSSTIAAFASRYTPGALKTFTVSFDNHELYDEAPLAKLVAAKYQTDHHVLHADAHCAEHLLSVVRHFDEPFGNPTAVLEYILTKLMREHVTVALSGDGGDELFGGYERHRGAKFVSYYQKLPRVVTKGLISHLSHAIHEHTDGRNTLRRLRKFAEVGWQPLEDLYLNWVGYFSEAQKAELYTPEFAVQVRGRDSADFLRERFRKGEKLDPLNRLGYVDLTSYLTCNCLEYSDRMSMANSMEVRCPLTDQRLVEFAMRIPPELKFRGTKTKWILRAAMQDELPRAILKKRKAGFAAPAPRWINGELRGLVQELLSPERVQRRGVFRPQAVASLVHDHSAQRRDNSYKIWALLMLELWFQTYIDSGCQNQQTGTKLAKAEFALCPQA